jgi:hypothetical protein
MICPVSLREYADPRVLPCGHTLDYSSILQLEKDECPLCRRLFNKRDLPRNWSLIKLLDITVEIPSADDVITQTRKNCIYARETIAEDNVVKILKTIEHYSRRGCTTCRVFMKNLTFPKDAPCRYILRNEIKSLSVGKGFGVKCDTLSQESCFGFTHEEYIDISW